MLTGLSFLFSIIGVIAVILWVSRVEKSKDPRGIHKGLFGVKEDQKKPQQKKVVPPPWQVSQIKRDDEV